MARWRLSFGAVAFLAVAGFCGCHTPTPTVVDLTDRGETRPISKPTDQEKKPEAIRQEAPFRLPDDATGKLLARWLPPGSSRIGEGPSGPVAGNRYLPRLPEPPLAPAATGLTRLPVVSSLRMTRPDLLLEEDLQGTVGGSGVLLSPAFPTGRLEKVQTPDVSIAPPLPVLAVSPIDRVSLEDPTLEASREAVLAAPLLIRVKPLPFERITKPEPFANRTPLTLEIPDEESNPQAPAPTRPR